VSLFGAASSRWQGDIGSQEYLADTASCDCAEQLTTVIVEPAHEYYIWRHKQPADASSPKGEIMSLTGLKVF
jgi:hypothetical protein